MKHENIRWNPATQEWYCTKCGRTSDHTNELDAHSELEQFECSIPWVDIAEVLSDSPQER
ncbi:MAG: hypothetical protein ACRD3H_18460 [Terriglobales bacterium]|jgi:hypothetical protein|nr:hypothetical protein [Terriglobales bacterium]